MLSARRLVCLAAAVVLAGAGLTSAAPGRAAPPLGAGCDPARAAVSHLPGGVVTQPDGPRAVPCGTDTGFYTGETGIAVTQDGTVWFSAANWEWQLARSKDEGRTWEAYTVPGPQANPGCGIGTSALTECDDSETAKNNTVADAFVHVDPYGGRLFWAKTFGYAVCASLNYTDDGRTWRPNTRFGCPGGDYEKVAAGPPPPGGEKPVGYSSVVYGCTNGLAPTFVVGPGRVCYKSLDGGASFVPTGLPPVPSPSAPGCLHFQEAQVVGPDGTVFLGLGCTVLGPRGQGGDAFLAYSTDEAATWQYAPIPTGGKGPVDGTFGGGVSTAVDRKGTVHVTFAGDDGKVYLASTKDRGRTWSGPHDVTKPGVVVDAPVPQVAALEDGHVAVAYYGHDPKTPALRNGYLTETFTAGSAKPVLESAQLNATEDPLYFPVDGGSLPRNDYLGVTIGPDGTPWTALVKLRSKTPSAEGFIPSTGFAGRLVRPER